MKFRWTISTDDGLTFPREVNPSNNAGKVVTWERKLEDWQAFFRKEISGPLRFRGTDWTYFHGLDRIAATRCKKQLLKFDQLCDGSWREIWRGSFVVSDGTFDYELCEFSVKPETIDRYNCLLDNWKTKRNILKLLPVTARAVILPPNVEFGMCSTVPGGDCDDQYRVNHGWARVYVWQPFLPGSTVTYNLYWRERVNRPCVYDPALGYYVPSPPPGDDWQLIGNACNVGDADDNCLEIGSCVYVRQVDDTYTFGEPLLGTGNSTTGYIPPSGMEQPLWVGQELGSANPVIPTCTAYPNDLELSPFDSWFISLANGDTQEYPRARTLASILDFLARETGCEFAGIRSTFFGINPTGGSTGTNYVTGEVTETEGILLLQKTDAILPTASNPATVAEMSLEDIFDILGSAYRVLWDIDSDGYLRIEHWKYWLEQTANGLDTTAWTGRVVEPMIRTPMGASIPRIERVKFAEAQGEDFVGLDLVYTGACSPTSAKGDVKEYNLGNVTTDIGFIQFDSNAIEKKGFAMLATQYNEDDSVYDVIIVPGAISGTMVVNAPMSTANLQRDYWTWDRYMPSGEMNGTDTTFDYYRPNIEQEDIRLFGNCCESLRFDPRKLVTSAMGEQYLNGKKGEVESAEYDPEVGRLKITLRYAR